jgi:cysteinyl-tRNA synthetase
VPQNIIEALAEDLNTPLAITHMHKLAADANGPALQAALTLMGINLNALEKGPTVDLHSHADALAALRAAAMETKDFSAVDAMKAALVKAGVEVRMSKAGVELVPGPDFDAAYLEGL